MHSTRAKLLAPTIVLVLTISAITAVGLLIRRADDARQAQLQVSAMGLSLADLQSAPFNADPSAGGSAAIARSHIRADESSLQAGLSARAQSGVSERLLGAGRSHLTTIEPVVQSIYVLALEKGGLSAGGAHIPRLQELLTLRSQALTRLLDEVGRADAARAAWARTQVEWGTAVAMALLLAAFAYFYFRSLAAREAVERLAEEKESLLGVSRTEARTDALTQLGNRRALSGALAAAVTESPQATAPELLLAMFDLDGFKQYNDTFGHAAGDALLQRFGGRLESAVSHAGAPYRMGGDEFCVLVRCPPGAAEGLLDDAFAALQESGEGWSIGASYGAVWIPSEADDESGALKLADERMYANKATRSSASRQVTDALLQVITEQSASLNHHVERVAELAATVAARLGQEEHEVRLIGLAAELHDVGKTAIPSTILDKPGPLDEGEWEFVRRHPLVGERIALAAPALASAAPLIRSSHERIDGLGYPDGLAGEDIPLGARIIAVCDAFDAMTSRRAYRSAMTGEAALAELLACAGTQFDAAVIAAFCEVKLGSTPVTGATGAQLAAPRG